MAAGYKTGGRKKGSLNKATAESKVLAGEYGPGAIKKLAELGGLIEGAQPAQSEAARVTALGMLLDRAYGKATQPVQHGVDEGLEELLDRLGAAP